jgi:MGT family glycosyltransferase
MHVLFYMPPFYGHLNPSLGVAAELARRGHRVSYATTTEFASLARDAGAVPVIYADPWRLAGRARAVPASVGASGDGNGSVPELGFTEALGAQLRELAAVLPQLTRAFPAAGPDVVICDPMCWAGLALGARWQVPVVKSITSMLTHARWSLGDLQARFDPADHRLPQVLAATSAILAREGTGLTADRLIGASEKHPAIVFYPRAFVPDGDEFGPEVHFVGPCLAGRRPQHPGAAGHGRPPGDQAVILVSLGTVFNRQPDVYRLCLDALADLGCHVVAVLGGMDAAQLGPLPPNAQVYEDLPLPEVLCFADVFVGHAGMTSIMEALSVGVPIAAWPQIAEHRRIADRVEELGLGIRLGPEDQTHQGLRRAVAALRQDPGVRARLAWMRGEIERAPGACAAAEVIEGAPGRK